MRLWRERNKPVFLPKNCEMCGDEFSPIRKWQRFCHHDCMILWQNNYGRARHQNIYGVFYSEFFKLYIVNEKKDVLEKEVLSTDPHIRDIHVLKKCASPVCKCLCKIVKRQYSDKPDRIVSWQVGWTYDEKLDELACKSCQIRFEIISDNNYKQDRTSQVIGKRA
jgi:hypothetical protein